MSQHGLPISYSGSESREDVHKKSFTKWLNAKLSKADPPVKVKDLFLDLKDGTVLLTLLETLTGVKLEREKGRHVMQRIGNMNRVFEQLKKEKVKIVGINPSEIVHGSPLATLGLMWHIILRFQMQEAMKESSQGYGIEKKLFSWCERRLDGYREYVRVENLSTSWRDGLAFNALMHSYRPSFSMEKVKAWDNATALEHAFELANRELGVPRIIEAKDVNVDKPDKKLITLYLTCLYEHMAESSNGDGKTEIVPEFEESLTIKRFPTAETSVQSSMEIEPISHTREVMSFVSHQSTFVPMMQQARSETVTYKTKMVSSSSSRVISSSSSSVSSTEPSSPTETLTHTAQKQFYLKKKSSAKLTKKKIVMTTKEAPEFIITEVKKATVASVDSPDEMRRKRMSDFSSTSSEDTVIEVSTAGHELEAAMDDSWDQIDTQQLYPRTDKYVALKSKFGDVELLLSGLETKLATLSGSQTTNREYTFKMCLEEIETIRTQVFVLINETGNLIDNRDITDEEADKMKENMERVEKRVILITERCNKEFERSSLAYLLSVKQWLREANDQIATVEDRLAQKDFRQLLLVLAPTQTKVTEVLSETRSVVESNVLTEAHENEVKEILGTTERRLNKFLEDYNQEHSKSSAQHLQPLKMKLSNAENAITALDAKVGSPDFIEVDLDGLQVKVAELVKEGQDKVAEKYFVQSDEKMVRQDLANVQRRFQELEQRYSLELMEKMKKELDKVDMSLSELESHLSLRDTARCKELMELLNSLEKEVREILQKDSEIFKKKLLIISHSDYIKERTRKTAKQLSIVSEHFNNERKRLSSEQLKTLLKRLDSIDSLVLDTEPRIIDVDPEQEKDAVVEWEAVREKVEAVVEECRNMIDDKYFVQQDENKAQERLSRTEKRLNEVTEKLKKEQERRSTELLETLKSELSDVESCLTALEKKSNSNDKDVKKEFMEEFEPVENKITVLLEEGRDLIGEKRLHPVHAKHVDERLNGTESRLKILLETYTKERERSSVEYAAAYDKKLDDVQKLIFDLSEKLHDSNPQKGFDVTLSSVLLNADDVLDEGQDLIDRKCFTNEEEDRIQGRIDDIVKQIEELSATRKLRQERSSAELMNKLKKKFDDVESLITEMERNAESNNRNKQKEFRDGMTHLEVKAKLVTKEGKHALCGNCLTKPDTSYIEERVEDTEERLENLLELHRMERKRYSASLKNSLDKKLNHVETLMANLETKMDNSDSNKVDIKDLEKELESVQREADDVLDEAQDLMDDKRFIQADERKLQDRVEDIERRLENLEIVMKEWRERSATMLNILVDFKKKLSEVETKLKELEDKSQSHEKNKRKEFISEFDPVAKRTNSVLKEVGDTIARKHFSAPHEKYLVERMDNIEAQLRLLTNVKYERISEDKLEHLIEKFDGIDAELKSLEATLHMSTPEKGVSDRLNKVNDGVPIVLDEGRELIQKEVFIPSHENVVAERMCQTEEHLQDVLDLFKRRRERSRVDHLKNALDDIDASLFSVEQTLYSVQKKYSDPVQAGGKSIEEYEEFAENVGQLEARGNEVLGIVRQALSGDFEASDKSFIEGRIEQTSGNLKEIVSKADCERKRISNYYLEYLKNKLSELDTPIFALEFKLGHVNNERFNYVDFMADVSEIQSKASKLFKEGRNMVLKSYFTQPDAAYITERMDETEQRLQNLQTNAQTQLHRSSGGHFDFLKMKLDQVEKELNEMEKRSKVDEKDYIDLRIAKQQLDTYKEYFEDLSAMETRSLEVLDEARHMIFSKMFAKADEVLFRERIEDLSERLKALIEFSSEEKQSLFEVYILLLLQYIARVDDWITRAEKTVKLAGGIGPSYDTVKSQTESLKNFEADLGDHSVVHVILQLDITDPDIDDDIRQQVRTLSERWAAVWNWFDERKQVLSQVFSDWEKFRTTSSVLLNWLTAKEKDLELMNITDLTDNDELRGHYELLEEADRQMKEQDNYLRELHELAEQLIADADYDDTVAGKILDQLRDFDDCWNELSDRISHRKDQLTNFENNLKQFGEIIGTLKRWMNETEKLLNEYSASRDGIDRSLNNESSNLDEKIEIKCEERNEFRKKMDLANRLSKEMSGNLDPDSHQTMQKVLKPVNTRWKSISDALDNCGAQSLVNPNECCFVRLIKRGLVMTK